MMKNEKILQVVKEITTFLEKGEPDLIAERFEEDRLGTSRYALCHVLWMAKQIPGFLKEERREKVMRWLGFMQGVLWARGYRSIENLKNQNKGED